MKNALTVYFLLISIYTYGQGTNILLFDRAFKYHEEGEYDKAILIYSAIIKADSSDYPSWNNRGQCYRSQKRYELALQDLKMAASIDSSDSSLFFTIGLAHIGLKHWEKGIEYLKRSAWMNYPESAFYLENLGSCYYFIGELDSAKKYLLRGLALYPANNVMLTNLAFSFLGSDPAKSCSLFKIAYDLDTINARNINNLGYSHYLCGNLDTAYFYYQKSLSIDPENSYLYRNIGLYYMRLEDSYSACKYFDLALEKGFVDRWGIADISELAAYCEKKR